MSTNRQEIFSDIRAVVDARIAERDERADGGRKLQELKDRLMPRRKPIRRNGSVGRMAFRTVSCRTRIGLEEPLSVLRLRNIRVPSVKPRPPDLHAACLSFAAHIVIAVRDRFGGDAPRVYTAARITRQAYSQIVSDETHKISKHTAIRFAFALRLAPAEAVELLKSAGYAFSNSLTEDFILQACLENDPPVWNLDDVNMLLREYSVDYQY